MPFFFHLCFTIAAAATVVAVVATTPTGQLFDASLGYTKQVSPKTARFADFPQPVPTEGKFDGLRQTASV